MRNPFDILTSTFIDRPKVCLSIGLIGILTVSSMAMFIEFDNSISGGVINLVSK